MTDDEYREYLNALAAEYLLVGDLAHHLHGPMGELGYELVRLSSWARLAKVVGERSEDPALVNTLAQALQNTYLDGVYPCDRKFGSPGGA
jgi:hypothetical protein